MGLIFPGEEPTPVIYTPEVRHRVPTGPGRIRRTSHALAKGSVSPFGRSRVIRTFRCGDSGRIPWGVWNMLGADPPITRAEFMAQCANQGGITEVTRWIGFRPAFTQKGPRRRRRA